jgi:pimeloyl-ACP methyl ester carboxylesterase
MSALRSVRHGSGPPLVLVHGLGARWQSWSPVLQPLAAAREVVAVDLPGHGATPALPGALTLERLVDDLQEWLVEQQLTGADLVGSSMGARMVLELARRGIGRHAVALDPGGFWTPGERAVFGASVRASFALVKALRPALPALAGSAAGRTALLPQFTPRPWAVPADVALTDLRSIADTEALFPTLQALLDSGPQQGGTDARARRAGLGPPRPRDARPPGSAGAAGLPARHGALVRAVRSLPDLGPPRGDRPGRAGGDRLRRQRRSALPALAMPRLTM